MDRIIEPTWAGARLLVLSLFVACSAGAAPQADHGGLDRRSQADTQAGTGEGRLIWRFRTGGAVRGTPDLADGVLYAGSADGALYALSTVDGHLLWDRVLGGEVGSPTVSGARVFVWERGNRLHALDASDGSPDWRFDAGEDRPLDWGYEGWDYLLPAPAVAGDTVYAGAGDGVLYALEASDGSERWRFRTGGRLRATPIVDDGVIYVGSGDGILYALDASDGGEVWRFQTEGVALDAADFGYDRTQIMGAVAVSEDSVYFGSRDARLYALDRATGDELWRMEEESAWVVAAPTVAGDHLYSARSSSANVRALDLASGTERWLVTEGGPVFASPVRVGDTLFVVSESGVVHALSASDGQTRWRFEIGGGIWGTPVPGGGRLYITSDDGSIYALTDDAGYRAPGMHVFWDEIAAESGFLLNGSASGAALKDALVNTGFQVADTAATRDLLEAGGAGDVIVVAMDRVPEGVEAELHGFLAAGGRVVWLGLPPGMLEQDPESGRRRLSRDQGSEFLGVDLTAWNADIYPASPTEEGRRMGLGGSWLASPSTTVDDDTLTVLARDNLGRPAAWSRAYEGGGRFVFLGLRPGAIPACQVALVAGYGLTDAGSADRAPPCGVTP